MININRRVFLMSYLSLYVFILTSHKSMVKFNNHLKLHLLPAQLPAKVWSSSPGFPNVWSHLAPSCLLCTIPQVLMYSKEHWSKKVRLEAAGNRVTYFTMSINIK